MNRLLTTLLAVGITSLATAQDLTENLGYKVEVQGSVSKGKTPLWLNANKYGLSSLDETNGYVRAALARPVATDSTRRWAIGYGLDLALTHGFTSRAVVQQAYGEVRWLKGLLTVGSKEQPMELKNSRLSSGSQTLGINARPVPQVRLSLPEYYALPFTKGWLSIKGHIAYGMFTDDNWQADFTARQSKYTENVLYHSKAGYLKIGNDYRYYPVSLELGLEMACQFGGTSYVRQDDGTMRRIENESGPGAFFDALIPGGGETVETTYQNAAGNQLGSWVARLNFNYETWYLGIYADHFFEDHSGLFHLDYDGYGEGEEWNVSKKRRYVLYGLKDIMLGAELKLRNSTLLNNIVFEYMYTKYQSGPVYHDRTESFPDHVGGIDNYYNHYIFTGWQHWGQVMGNPLYLSPIYNDDGRIVVKDNRFYAFHLGLAGNPSYYLGYRVLATWQKGYGTYFQPTSEPYDNPKENLSLLAEATYDFPESSRLVGWSVRGGLAADFGKLMGNNWGVQLTVARAGLIGNKDKRKKK